MVRKNKQKIQKLKHELYSLKWESSHIHASEMDPDMKAIYLNDVEYKAYRIQQEIDEIEHKEAMIPLKVMLAGFVIFAIVMLIYRISH